MSATRKQADARWEADSSATTDVSASNSWSAASPSTAASDKSARSVSSRGTKRSTLNKLSSGSDSRPGTEGGSDKREQLPPLDSAEQQAAAPGSKQTPRPRTRDQPTQPGATHLPQLVGAAPASSAPGTPLTAPMSASGLPSGAARFCIQCGSNLVPGGRFCAVCGTPVAQLVAATPTQFLRANLTTPSTAGEPPKGSLSARTGRRQAPLQKAQTSASMSPRPGRKRQEQAMSSTAPAGGGFFPKVDRVGLAEPSASAPAGEISKAKPPAFSNRILNVAPSRPEPNLDATLLSVAKRMGEALNSYYRKLGVHHGVQSWDKFFADVDTDGSGRMTFEELDNAVRNKLRTGISRYELRVFWRRVDADDSGMVTPKEFSRLMYRIDIMPWPTLNQAQLERVVRVINTAAEKWHRSGGNWFKIFNSLDADQSGTCDFEEFKRMVRFNFPGLQLKEKDVTEEELKGLWKTLDNDFSMEVSVSEFTVFMRRHGASQAMHRLTKYSKKMRGLEEKEEGLGDIPERTKQELRSISGMLEQALRAYWSERGVHANTHCTGGSWNRFFQEVDTDGSGRLRFPEFVAAVQTHFGKWTSSITMDDWKAFWQYMDPDQSGEVNPQEFSMVQYRLELEFWPIPDEALLTRIVTEMNSAATKWHRAGGNWYKLFCIVDSDGSGHIGFDELKELVRLRVPCLQIPLSVVSEDELKAFWKALDDNKSAEVSVQEFMSFMRKWGSQHSMHRLTEYTKKKRGLQEKQRDVAAEINAAPTLQVEELRGIASRLAILLHVWLQNHGIGVGGARSDVVPPRVWYELFRTLNADGSDRLTYPEFETATKTILKAGKTISEQELKTLWKHVDADASGECGAKEFSTGLYRIQLSAWPTISEEHIVKIIGVLNRGADKWHRAAGNWYKVFAACDEDGSGEMEFEEMVGVVRKSYPGLSIPAKDINDTELRGLWRAIDNDQSGMVTTKEFMSFMRSHGKMYSMHKLTSYSKDKRGLIEKAAELGPAPERSRDQLRQAARLLSNALAAYWAKRGVHINVAGNWPLFFEEADKDGSGRLTFVELDQSIRQRLQRRMCEEDEVIRGVTQGDLLALWYVVDLDRSGEVTGKEWQVNLYRLDIEDWPVAEADRLRRIVDEINGAAQKWHQAGGNWYKVFRLIDTDNSGKMGFDELREICWRPLPCLAIPPRRLPEKDLRTLWKALDSDQSGMCTVNEFMIFMRKHGTVQFHSSPRERRPRFVGLQSPLSRSESQAAAGVPLLTADQVNLLSSALSKQSGETMKAAYKNWDLPWDGNVSEWDFLLVFRRQLGISEEQICDDAVHACWTFLESSSGGQVSVGALLSLGQGLREAMDASVRS
mmetsp:Transcript_54805/g.102773  ORF Transcript_54805/g.102773 Transcript_54805/m.102773 type:complete len:1348 (+) Transcript_54805:158-4201(+)